MNVPLSTNFGFFPGATGLLVTLKTYILLHKFVHFKGYVYSQIFRRLCLFKGLCVFQTLEY